MKRTLPLVLLGLLLSLATAVAAQTSQTSVLVSCDNADALAHGSTAFSGHVRVQFKTPNAMVVRAEAMTYDPVARRMTFSGDVEMTGNGPTVRAKELALDFGTTDVNVYRLNSEGIVTGAGPVSVSPHMPGAKAFSAPEETRKP